MRVPSHRDIDANDPILLDRLVDGEMTELEERAFIARLKEAPDGWKRCALAFLEARCWQRTARQISDSSASGQKSAQGTHGSFPAAQPPVTPRPRKRPQWPMRWAGVLALSALFVAAFTAGICIPTPWRQSGPHSARQPATSTQLADRKKPAAHEQARPTEDRHSLVERQPPAASQELLLGNLTLVDDSGHKFDIPVYDWNEQVAERLMYHSQALSPEFFEHLKRHRVRSHQSYLPVKLQDGRQVVVPVQKLEIVPVGGAAY